MLKRVMSQFFVQFFCLTGPQNAVGDSFSLSLISDIGKVWMRGWWAESIKIFRRSFLVSQNRNIS